MSRPTALQRAQADAAHTKALTTYAEITMAVEVVDGVTTRECARFGPDGEIARALIALSVALEQARRDAETRVRKTEGR